MIVTISPVQRNTKRPRVTLTIPPDKSILHRLFIIGSLTTSDIILPNISISFISRDVLASIEAMRALGSHVEEISNGMVIHGCGRYGLAKSSQVLDCANSGTTARLLMGLLCGQTFDSLLVGDASLSKRPMKRVAAFLEQLGARITTSQEGSLPLQIHGSKLTGREIELTVPSAQIKSALLLAGLYAEGDTTIRGKTESRDHTERMLLAFGFDIEVTGNIRISGNRDSNLPPLITYNVPGDISSAAFLIAAAVLLKRAVIVKQVLLNPTRTRFLDILSVMGVDLEITNIREEYGEERGDVTVFGDLLKEALTPFDISGEDIPLLIDELPILMVLALFANGPSTISDAGELRVKESDRLGLSARQFEAFGVKVEESQNGLLIHGIPDRQLIAGKIEHGGDHRLAMAFSIASLFAAGPTQIDHAESVAISYPQFFSDLGQISGSNTVDVQL